MTDRKIIVVTGCRDWDDETAVTRELSAHLDGCDLDGAAVYVGDCPTGADAIATEVVRNMGFAVIAYAADWGKHGRAAGPLRNREMCEDASKDAKEFGLSVLCLAFWDGNSKGTLDCIKQATALGIGVRIIPRQP